MCAQFWTSIDHRCTALRLSVAGSDPKCQGDDLRQYDGDVRPTTLCLFALAVVLLGCPSSPEDPPPAERGARPVPAETEQPAPGRLIALGDVHGDFSAMMAALDLAGVVDGDGAWIGGETVVVQTGDQLDRGDEERRILDTISRLADEAWAAGGALHALNGNHEAMNVELDLRYVTPAGFAEFADLTPDDLDAELMDYPEEERGRVAAFRPGGPTRCTWRGRTRRWWSVTRRSCMEGSCPPTQRRASTGSTAACAAG